MALLRARKEINKLKRQRNNKTPMSLVKALPNELLVDIVGKMASYSMADLCQIKFSCKEFLNASKERCAYQHASMDKFALIPLPWFTGEKETSFLKLCRESGNLEIIYREGMVQYFSTSMVNLGFENLKKAALGGHHEAKYVYSMLLMANSEDEEGRKLGFDLFRELKNSTSICVVTCRNRVRSFIQSMWVKNHAIVQNQGLSLCCSSTCDAEKVQVKKHSTWYSDEFDNDVRFSCKYCDGNYELITFFRKMFRV